MQPAAAPPRAARPSRSAPPRQRAPRPCAAVPAWGGPPACRTRRCTRVRRSSSVSPQRAASAPLALNPRPSVFRATPTTSLRAGSGAAAQATGGKLLLGPLGPRLWQGRANACEAAEAGAGRTQRRRAQLAAARPRSAWLGAPWFGSASAAAAQPGAAPGGIYEGHPSGELRCQQVSPVTDAPGHARPERQQDGWPRRRPMRRGPTAVRAANEAGPCAACAAWQPAMHRQPGGLAHARHRHTSPRTRTMPVGTPRGSYVFSRQHRQRPPGQPVRPEGHQQSPPAVRGSPHLAPGVWQAGGGAAAHQPLPAGVQPRLRGRRQVGGESSAPIRPRSAQNSTGRVGQLRCAARKTWRPVQAPSVGSLPKRPFRAPVRSRTAGPGTRAAAPPPHDSRALPSTHPCRSPHPAQPLHSPTTGASGPRGWAG